MANSLKLYEVHSFSTSPNSRQCTTVLNADKIAKKDLRKWRLSPHSIVLKTDEDGTEFTSCYHLTVELVHFRPDWFMDWLTEHGLTSAPTQYRLYGRVFTGLNKPMALLVEVYKGLDMPILSHILNYQWSNIGIHTKYNWNYSRLVTVKPMAHDPSSPSKLLVPEFRTRNLEATTEHVLFCPSFWYQTNLVPECLSDVQSYYEISGTSNLDGELGSCAIGLREMNTAMQSWTKHTESLASTSMQQSSLANHMHVSIPCTVYKWNQVQ